MTDLRVKYGTKNTKKADFFHSSGYAKAQSPSGIGISTDSSTFAARKALEDQRKYIKKYQNSRLLQGIRAYDRVKSYTPRVEKAANLAPGRGSLTPGRTLGAPSSAPTRPSFSTAPTISSPPSRRVPPIKL